MNQWIQNDNTVNSLLLITNTQCCKVTQTTLHNTTGDPQNCGQCLQEQRVWQSVRNARSSSDVESVSESSLVSGNACVDAFNIALVWLLKSGILVKYLHVFTQMFIVLMKPWPHNIGICNALGEAKMRNTNSIFQQLIN